MKKLDKSRFVQKIMPSKKRSRYQFLSICLKRNSITRESVKKYLSESFEPVNAHYGNRREGKLAQYREIVIQMYREGHAYKAIFCHIKALGYHGTKDAIRGFVSKEKKIQADFPDSNSEELIERKWLVQLLYKPFSEVKRITVEQLNAVKLKYPAVEKIYSIIAEFRDAFTSGVPDLLTGWMQKTKTFEITELNSFISGLERDVDAVKNAMLYSFNNGLAEGSVNKLKVVKRIMYGRCSFGLLKAKLLALDYWRHFN